jgi:penicillin-insensitive murein endopeptidase
MHLRRIFLSFLLAAIAPTLAAAADASPWSEALTPAAGPPHIVGSAANGCIAGAMTLPAAGPGFEAIRLSRHRTYGHPATIAFVERLGRDAAAAGLPAFYVGDLSHPRGGPMPGSHARHQNGLDVDIWFNLDPKPRLPAAARETVSLPSMLRVDGKAIDPARFGKRQVELLRLAAADPAVDRIFVNPAIKRALCRGVGGAAAGGRSWLHRIRPWFGHAAHFHVRLRCPTGAKDCVGQPPVPPGDGCNATLAWWFKPHPPAPSAPKVHPSLPAQCRAIVAGE